MKAVRALGLDHFCWLRNISHQVTIPVVVMAVLVICGVSDRVRGEEWAFEPLARGARPAAGLAEGHPMAADVSGAGGAGRSAGRVSLVSFTDAVGHAAEPASRDAAYEMRPWYRRFSLGGYGEMHWNFDERPGRDLFDFHRFVLDVNYQFSPRLVFQSELEIEHAFTSKDTGGEIVFEQAYVEYILCEPVHIRAGRILIPLGIINPRHEPPAFNGVERPAFAKYIIPSTWSGDGLGVTGWLLPSLTYEFYLVTSLDGSQFNAVDGIREGRLHERPSLNQMAFTGRLDWYPFAMRRNPGGQLLRMGISTFLGGLDNGNKGVDPGIAGRLHIVSYDFEYTIGRFDLRGVIAFEAIHGAEAIGNGTASEILGGYLEGAVHVWPDAWKCGRLRRADAIVFLRWDDYDTQHRMPLGIPKNPAGDRNDLTVGCGFLPQPNFVIKLDYQIRDDASESDVPELFNVGIGWQF